MRFVATLLADALATRRLSYRQFLDLQQLFGIEQMQRVSQSAKVKNVVGFFVTCLASAFSDALLALCEEIAFFPHADFEDVQLSAFKELYAKAQVAEQAEVLATFGDLWGIAL